ncbi:MAG TPA: site-2 protease family protein [Armatimonadota bacterium]|nr:site-2 protease family protein [Armatimonadota bacterium]
MGDIQEILIMLFVLVISLTVHELAHAKSAEMAGDDTARRAGRITLNPLAHLDPLGSLMMVVTAISGIGIGWAKPVPVNPYRFRNPRWDNLKVSLWGPLSNLLLAFFFAQIIRFYGNHLGNVDYLFVGYFVIINIGLAVFNLIPIAPLDGSHIMSSLLPLEQARRYELFMAQYGGIILLALVFMGPMFGFSILRMILGPPRTLLFKLFTGIPW